ncbi:AraC family transcriptional regulator [Pedobacter arcticus]|uniref:AraC family transcriptional regulator n=1 Tax=Pedobacter arcticus TaxID=752140 RepID=UPI0002DBDA2B|nr:AraC family transcriptional regulator [Pedobacter arcticus]
MAKKKQGFAGQRIIELSKEAIGGYCAKHPSFKNGYFTKVGFFPDAKYQFIEENDGRAEYVLIYCVKGYGVAIIDHKIFHISPGDFFLIPSNTPFSYYSDKIKPWTIYWFFFKGEAIQEIADLFVKSAKSYKGYLPYNDERVKLFNKIYKFLEQGYGKENLILINMCLLNLISSFVLITADISIKTDKFQLIINSSMQFMKENIENNLNLNQLAANVNLSVSHFSSVFKRITGVSPMNYYNDIKIQKACEYLKYSNTLVKEISYKLGIFDVHYFSRLFSKTMGITPLKYRLHHRSI